MCCFVAAVWQWVEVGGRLAHCGVMVFKFGFAPPFITAGTSMIAVFFSATSIFVALAGFARMMMPDVESLWRRCAEASVAMLLCGAIVWGGLLASPIVAVVHR